MTSKNTINEINMRMEFETWARQKGAPVRRRDDKPDVYLFSETQRQWLIWSEAYIYGKMAALAQGSSAKAGAPVAV